MDKVKNYVIAILTGLLVLSLFTQPAQSAPAKSKEAKAVEYHVCMTEAWDGVENVAVVDNSKVWTNQTLAVAKACATLRP